MTTKTTGIVRRIDDLGRVIIPKQLRKELNLKEGQLIEFIYAEEGLLLRFYDEEKELK